MEEVGGGDIYLRLSSIWQDGGHLVWGLVPKSSDSSAVRLVLAVKSKDGCRHQFLSPWGVSLVARERALLALS